MKIRNLQLLQANNFNGKIAIVGNAGITPADNHELKDRHVIRFNNYASRAGIQHGFDRFRCDTLFTTFDLHSVGSKPDSVVIGIPSPFNIDTIPGKLEAWYPNSSPYMVNPYMNHMMCQELGIPSEGYKHPFPSIGFTCLWHLHNLGVFDRNDIYICGFNWYFDWNTKLCQGKEFGLSSYPNHWNHNYPNEVRWIVNRLLDRININFSSDCKRILEYAKQQLSCAAS